MSTNKDLFKEAIADAKQVREAALVNAKAALEEALGPKLQSMISAKLQEMENDEDDEKLEEVDYISANDKRNDSDMIRKRAIDAGQMSEGEEELEEDFDLSEILAELDAEKEEKEEIKEAEEEEAGEEEEVEDEESEMEPTEEPAEEETADEDGKITDLTVDQLKDIIKDIISSELEAEEYETEADEEAEMGGEEMGMEMGAEETADEDEINLEELLAELDALNEGEEKEEEELKEFVGTETADSGMIAALATLLGVGVPLAVGLVKQLKQAKTPAEKKQVIQNELPGNSEMKEAIDTINTLRDELNEVNLLNAKLLYVNKIFKAKNLSESQKLKVIASFDKATTPKQAKELFESIQDSDLGASKKSQIKESLGFASKAAGVAPKSTIVESNDVIARMQKLANIIK
jgi:hypothetical protein